MEKKSLTLLLGAHTSAAHGVHNALLEGAQIEATTVQLFTSNQRQWKAREIPDAQALIFKNTLKETNLTHIMSHDSYLINLGAPSDEILKKSHIAFEEEIKRCLKLGITYLNFHPGAALKSGLEPCLEKIVASLLLTKPLLENSSLRLLLETTAGQGSTVGARFEEIGYIIERVKGHLPIGVCMDTCHTFAAGYDLRDRQAVDETLKMFEEKIGLEHLYAFHLNDSLKGLGSRVDRHKPLGEGEIGMECFKILMTHPKTAHLPKYLETPGGPDLWKKEIALLKSFVKG
jgi:deoxyribonuclease IV